MVSSLCVFLGVLVQVASEVNHCVAHLAKVTQRHLNRTVRVMLAIEMPTSVVLCPRNGIKKRIAVETEAS